MVHCLVGDILRRNFIQVVDGVVRWSGCGVAVSSVDLASTRRSVWQIGIARHSDRVVVLHAQSLQALVNEVAKVSAFVKDDLLVDWNLEDALHFFHEITNNQVLLSRDNDELSLRAERGLELHRLPVHAASQLLKEKRQKRKSASAMKAAAAQAAVIVEQVQDLYLVGFARVVFRELKGHFPSFLGCC